MNNLFEQLGKIAQQATGGNPADMLGKLKGQLPGGVESMGGAASDAFGKLKDSIPGGVGGLLGAGALGGILGVLMGGKGLGRAASTVGKGVLVAGGTAAAATLAWSLYQKWSQKSAPTGASFPGAASSSSSAPASAPQAALPSAQTDPAAMLVLEAMVFAARADGHLDDQERQAIHGTMSALFPGTDVAVSIDRLLNQPLNPEDLARRVQDREQACDVYRLSRLVISVDHPMERAYLQALAQAFGFSDTERQALDNEVETMRQQ